MNLAQFYEHWAIVENPFRGEEARTDAIFARIGINCHLCPRQACSQRAHQPLFVELPIDANRRGSTRYES